MGSNMLIGTTGSHMSLRHVRKVTPFGRWEMILQVFEECCLLSNYQQFYSPV